MEDMNGKQRWTEKKNIYIFLLLCVYVCEIMKV